MESLSIYLNQSGEDWISMAQAMDYNSVAIAMYIAGYIILCLSFYSLDILLVASVIQKGFFSAQHKRIVVWFLLFLFLCGTSFGVHTIAFFYTFYWVFAGTLFLTSLAALFTVILYIKSFTYISKLPSPKDVIDLQKENESLKLDIRTLNLQIELWSQDIEHHLKELKKEHTKLSDSVHNTQYDAAESDKQKILNALSRIKDEINDVVETMR